MKSFSILTCLLLLAAAPAWSGEGGKCSGTTQECLDYMANQLKNSGWVGVEMEGREEGGYVITKVVEGSPAESAGLQLDDVLLAINGIKLDADNEKKLQAARAEWKPGVSVTWEMSRAKTNRQVAITLAPMPADVLAKYIGNHMLQHATVEMAAK